MQILLVTLNEISPRSMSPEDVIVETTDKFKLAAQVYLNSSAVNPGITVILQSATGVPQGFYSNFAKFLIGSSVKIAAVITYDYRGVGKSIEGSDAIAFLKKHPEFSIMDHWALRDQADIFDYVRSRFAGNEIVLLGHSVGGQISPFMNKYISRMIWLSVNSPYYATSPDSYNRYFTTQVIGWTVTRAHGYFPSQKLGLGLPIPQAAGLDWLKSCGYPAAYAGYHKPAISSYAATAVKVLAINFDDDELALADAFTNILAKLGPGCQIKNIHIRTPKGRKSTSPWQVNSQIGHLGFFRKATAQVILSHNGTECSKLWESVLPFVLSGDYGVYKNSSDLRASKL